MRRRCITNQFFSLVDIYQTFCKKFTLPLPRNPHLKSLPLVVPICCFSLLVLFKYVAYKLDVLAHGPISSIHYNCVDIHVYNKH